MNGKLHNSPKVDENHCRRNASYAGGAKTINARKITWFRCNEAIRNSNEYVTAK